MTTKEKPRRVLRIGASLAQEAGVPRAQVVLLLFLDRKNQLDVHQAVFEVLDLTKGSKPVRPVVLDDGQVVVSRDEQGGVRAVEFLAYMGVDRLPEFLAYVKEADEGTAKLLANAHAVSMLCWRDVERAKDFALEVIAEHGDLEAASWPDLRVPIGDLIVKTLKSLQKIESDVPQSTRQPRRTRAPKRKALRWKPVPA